MPLDALKDRLAMNTELTVERDQAEALLVTVHDSLTGKDADVTISIDTGAAVAAEAEELAQQVASGTLAPEPGVPPPDARALAAAEARYEITWDLRSSDETYNAMAGIAAVLEQNCGAIIYDLTNRRLV